MRRPSSRWAHLRDELRQRRHHRAFRIAPATWDGPELEHLERLLAAAVRPSRPVPAEPRADDAPGLDEEALAKAVTELWRAQHRLARPGNDAAAQTRQAGRYLRAGRDVLTDAGLVVQDHDGEAFHPGRSVEALTYEDDPSLSIETVLQTIRPSIYLNGRRIQMGKVIVGRPAAAAGPQPDPNQ